MRLFPIIGQWAFDPDLLGRRMSFISGPRQVGKTTLALLTLKKLKQEQNYYNWDTRGVNRRFAQTPFFFLENIPHSPLSTKVPDVPRYMVFFDEFHKHPRWKQILKGYFDEFGSFIRFIVCGSARLDIFRKEGWLDSKPEQFGSHSLLRPFYRKNLDGCLGTSLCNL